MQTTTTTVSRESAGSAVAMTLGLCFIVALLEGLDLQSIGVAAPRMAREFGLSVGQMGLAFSAGTFGLLPGAMLGGRLADRIGRKRVLILATALFGVFSIATAHVWDFNSLLMIRVATGIGLGAAMPNLIALCAEAVPTRLRNTAVSVMYCGIPFGGAIAAVVGMFSAGDDGWRHIFYVGGFGPLVVVPLLLTLQESRRFDSAQRGAIQPPPVSWALFGERRAAATLLLWVSYFFTLIVLYFLLNWLPSLMAAQGLSRPQVGVVQILFNIGGGAGALGIGMLMDAARPRWVVSGMYVGIIAALSLLAAAGGMTSMSAGAFMAGLFVIGAQSVLYALAAAYYPTVVRGTGVGAAVAVGRLGSIAGPLLAGQLLAMGQHATTIIGASIPVTIIAALAALLLLKRPRVQD
ncbi:3-(3-hydroxy-phenyl)propionate transporter MhpT [Ralstonia insidiosa]|jgi:AAHS family 3-hydroxyphenylpropionic acid transporter|uniref:3-(3-hydroxy-phenyl)propionate transporter MhpT n=1 Tax=Ralstonia TaxID=48736 RepID=UPI000664AC96|nr:3-(3-hydroxy-phenyl)propionate transporter MhpT [Ralstonia insidiosa]KMW45645.1 MFS transporter [Ralstonia sp. MD27]MBX3772493.1 3-(3-hydroxy-phenyl)propionate transporter MhpT [Ralstonia pickettii]NOZ14761.1 3-(3-hydroxy-phenyl)propionate transporter MhpT [Betaproteobacteria bacterium]MBA9857148.1 3-(3-hydroxy-phenyl)propionate transporter MhpT [Ralstonia insidiosa]MBA9870250.1 3-(3-hydroxy-phenyl)propionate transporter MhpT [Ralstonia insidiosa]